MADNYIAISQLTAATDAQVTDSMLFECIIEDSNSVSGYTTRKVSRGQLLEGAGEVSVYWATYGTTTNAEIETALDSGLLIVCKYNDKIYSLTERVSSTSHLFTIIGSSWWGYKLTVINNTWATGSQEMVRYASSDAPQALGTASAGTTSLYSRGNHVHPMPSASDVGAIAAPSSPATGAFLVWNGSEWVAQTLSTWQGGSY